ncbi:MAG TPA: wax ester/triacylglycerol synthase family O-acyltransferase [Acidimicrobiales bacterium]|nr:wax ester/triacylglycerol synthase family O-acyltransferase [Acidimicrobiales bacterium]
MQRMTGLDAAFLYAETPSQHMHVALVGVFDTASMKGGYRFEAIKSLIEARLPRIPMFTRRLAQVPFRLHHPVLVEDPDFDIDFHVRRMAAPAPGSVRELCEMAGDFVSRPLDRSRPLWQMWVVEALEEGRIGILAKVHHSLIDGVTGAEVMVHLFDLEAEPAPEPVPETRAVERFPSDLELLTYAAGSMARQPARLASTLVGTARSIGGLARRRREGGSGMASPFSAPRTPWNGAITAHRAVAVGTLALEDIKAVKNAFGTTVNDVVLALCSGALRRYLADHGGLPEASLVSVVPVSVRSDDSSAPEGANQVSAMFVSLATDLENPADRLRAIAESTKGAKEEHHAMGADVLQNWAEFAAPGSFGRAMRLYSEMNLADRHRPIHNVIISNVPGPPFPLYMAGAKLAVMAPLGPIMEGAGLNVTVMSYMDRVDIGLIACRESIPDIWDLAEDFEVAMAELKKAVSI